MRPNAVRHETVGSFWWFDDEAHEYARMPKTEGPRPSPEGEDWGGPEAGDLQDLVWHPMLDWEVRDLDELIIRLPPDGERVIFAPGLMTEELAEERLGAFLGRLWREDR